MSSTDQTVCDDAPEYSVEPTGLDVPHISFRKSHLQFLYQQLAKLNSPHESIRWYLSDFAGGQTSEPYINEKFEKPRIPPEPEILTKQGPSIELQDTRHQRGWRRIIINFAPSWFSVNMGTGIASILLQNLPFNAVWIYWISVVLFGLNVFLFVLFMAISLLRYTMFSGMWSCMIKHPAESLFLGTIPMGFATIVNMVVFVLVPAWGDWVADVAWVMWWVDVLMSIGTNFYLPFAIMNKHESALPTMTAAWLLPIVATVVASASGGVVATVLQPHQALVTIITSYIIWGCGVPLALFTMVIYFQRLTLHALPPKAVIVSVFLPLGPLGQGSFAILQLGADALKVFPQVNTIPQAPLAGQVFFAGGVMLAFVMWGFGLVWLFFALASLVRMRKFPFNLGWWAFTFPLGVYATATTTFAKELPSEFFKILGTVFSLIVVVMWMIVTAVTLKRGLTGKLIVSPVVKSWEDERKTRLVPKEMV